MSLPYKYTVSGAVLTEFAVYSKRQREELLRIFSILSREPFTEGDFTEADATGRDCQVKRFRDWLVVYWPEHLVREIHILDVTRSVQKRK